MVLLTLLSSMSVLVSGLRVGHGWVRDQRSGESGQCKLLHSRSFRNLSPYPDLDAD
jgi:hypothetical protein